MRITDYWKIFRAHWIAVGLIVVLAGLLGAGLAAVQPKQYTADASGMLTTGSSTDLGSALSGDNFAKSRVKSYLDVAKSRAVAEDVRSSLGLDESPDALLRQVTVSNPEETSNLKVSVVSSSPEEAQRIAEAWIGAIGDQVQSLEGDQTIIQFVSLDSAQLPLSPSSPDMRLYVAAGLLIGAIAAAAYMLIRHQFDRRIRSVDSVEDSIGLPVIGTVPLRKQADGGRIVLSRGGNDHDGADAADYAIAESMRRLRTNLQFMDVDNPPRVLAITSSIPGEGKSFVIANLATTIAEAGQDVVVVDADLRRPVVAETFGVVGSVGLTDVLAGRAKITDVLQPWGETGHLFVLAAGSVPPNPSELLASRAMRTLLEELGEHAMVLIDTPPLLPVADAAILTAQTDGAMVVCSANKTTFDMLAESVVSLRRVHGRALGAIVNRVPSRGAGADGYGYRYRSYYGRAKQADAAAGTAAPSAPEEGEGGAALASNRSHRAASVRSGQ